MIYQISLMFDTVSTINNRLREKSIISAIYNQYIGFGPIYRFWTDISWKYWACDIRTH